MKREAKADSLPELEGGEFAITDIKKGVTEKDSGSALHHLDPAAGGFPHA